MLNKKYDTTIKELKGVLDFPWESPEFYAAWCAQTYFYSRHVTRILLMASAHSDLSKPKMHLRMANHAAEERNHEILAERDTKDLGYDLNQIGEFAATRGFYTTQYYTVQNVSPESLYGWILPLEGLAMHYGTDLLKCVKKNPKAPTRFLDVHTKEDPDHVSSAFEIVKDFSSEIQGQVIQNMEFTLDTYFAILKSCREFANRKSIKRAG